MIKISYTAMIIAISAIWLLVRAAVWAKNKQLNWKRELQLLFVYICLIVVARFTFFPFSKVNGAIQPLVFDSANMIPFRINFIPFVNLFDYTQRSDAILNFVGNTAMFIPIGVIWPIVYRNLDTHIKVIAAGIGFSLFIEVLQLPFFDRVTDIDDLILNSVGFLIGYGVYLLVKLIAKKKSGLQN
ncbi:MAG: VanZ family protein [Clostridia bacterium]|nr:VanZ family protein [Clostridia bacterium]